ncbi:MAG: 2-oxoglutarate ferredoxin oxidoreductase subunit gamma, partial [Bacteroidales bacterium]|nr:2-oxoglutarate ferredoxin oxidoreductase subunit gamma [Bacteroidales bacterium]
GLKKSLPSRYHYLIPENESAILRGMEIIEQIQRAA